MKEQAAYNVVRYEIDFYRAVTGQRARLWSSDSARHVMSDLGKALLRLNNTVPASSYSTSAGVAKVNERSCTEWTE